jgi:hypothetical protein
MAVQVDVWVWGQFSMAAGVELDWTFWITGADGISRIDPEHWYWMSAVPDYEPDPNPDLPAYATGLVFSEQGAYRPYQDPAGPNNAVWKATLKTSSGPEEGDTWFRPRMIVAPGA